MSHTDLLIHRSTDSTAYCITLNVSVLVNNIYAQIISQSGVYGDSLEEACSRCVRANVVLCLFWISIFSLILVYLLNIMGGEYTDKTVQSSVEYMCYINYILR